jgi:hypothetical protein
MPADPDKVMQQVQALDAQRTTWDSLWQELAEVVHPRRSTITKTKDNTPERAHLSEAFDGTSARANRTLAQGQAARITPMGARWFSLTPPARLVDNPEAVDWYQRCGEILAGALYRSNFYNRAFEHYLDRGAFGTAATEILAGKGSRGLHFRSYPIGTFSIAHDENDEVNTLARKFQWTVAQICEAFPKDQLPPDIVQMHGDPVQRMQKLDLVHFIGPRHDRDPRKSDAMNKPFFSVYLWPEKKAILSESGYDSFPVAVSRWELWGDSPYGWAPSLLALPEANQTNFLEQMLDDAAETMVYPRVLVPSGMKGEIDFSANGITTFDPNVASNTPPQEWLTNGRYDIGKDRLEDKRRAIEEAFFVPLFNAISQLKGDATATEVRALVSENRELFHPIFANLTREFLSPILRRSFAILFEQGAFPRPPAAIIRREKSGSFLDDPEVEFTSSMALALEQSHLANLSDVLSVLAPFAGTDPTTFDFMAMDRIGPALFRAKGLPADFIRTPDEMQALADARAQQMQAQQAQAAASSIKDLGGADGVRQIAENLPTTPL